MFSRCRASDSRSPRFAGRRGLSWAALALLVSANGSGGHAPGEAIPFAEIEGYFRAIVDAACEAQSPDGGSLDPGRFKQSLVDSGWGSEEGWSYEYSPDLASSPKAAEIRAEIEEELKVIQHDRFVPIRHGVLIRSREAPLLNGKRVTVQHKLSFQHSERMFAISLWDGAKTNYSFFRVGPPCGDGVLIIEPWHPGKSGRSTDRIVKLDLSPARIAAIWRDPTPAPEPALNSCQRQPSGPELPVGARPIVEVAALAGNPSLREERLLVRVAKAPLRSMTAHRTKNLLKAPFNLARIWDPPRVLRGVHQLGGSLLNPGGTLNDLITDVGTGFRSLSTGKGPKSSRIQVCLGNLGSSFSNGAVSAASAPWMPANHMGILIDGQERFGEVPFQGGIARNGRRGGMKCYDTRLSANDPEWLLAEKVNCLGQHFELRNTYSFLGYNCVGFLKDVLSQSGIKTPIFTNLGIGSGSQADRGNERSAALEESRRYCESQQLALESILGGRADALPRPLALATLRDSVFPLYPDSALRLAKEALNEPEAAVSTMLAQVSPSERTFEDTYVDRGRLRPHARAALDPVLASLSPNELKRMGELLPAAKPALEAWQKEKHAE